MPVPYCDIYFEYSISLNQWFTTISYANKNKDIMIILFYFTQLTVCILCIILNILLAMPVCLFLLTLCFLKWHNYFFYFKILFPTFEKNHDC